MARRARLEGRLPALARARDGEAAAARIHRVRARLRRMSARSPTHCHAALQSCTEALCAPARARGAALVAHKCARGLPRAHAHGVGCALGGRCSVGGFKVRARHFAAGGRAGRDAVRRRFTQQRARVNETQSTALTRRRLQCCVGAGDGCTQRRGGALQASIHARCVRPQLRSALGDEDRRERSWRRGDTHDVADAGPPMRQRECSMRAPCRLFSEITHSITFPAPEPSRQRTAQLARRLSDVASSFARRPLAFRSRRVSSDMRCC